MSVVATVSMGSMVSVVSTVSVGSMVSAVSVVYGLAYPKRLRILSKSIYLIIVWLTKDGSES